VLAVRWEDVEVEVEQVYSPPTLSGIFPGDHIRSKYSIGPTSCDGAAHEPAPSVGGTVLVATWGTEMWLVPWTDPLDLGDRQVPLDSLEEFADHGRCDADLPQEPCDDDGRTFACATGRAQGGSPGWLAMAVFVLGLALRRFGAPAGGRS
jgi:MYXO-CTERM domain-containing protein